MSYPNAVCEAFGTQVDYAELMKVFHEDRAPESHYVPATCIGCTRWHVIGAVDPEKISKSTVERSNLSLRIQQRRDARLANGPSKKLENHGHATALYLAYYNLCRKGQALDRNTTPATGRRPDPIMSGRSKS